MLKVEICKVTDKNASSLVETNLNAGYEVKLGPMYRDNPSEFYYIELQSEKVWRSPSAEFSPIEDSIYEFKKEIKV